MSVDGAWKITMNTPMGARDATLELTSNGSIMSGKWSGQQGAQEFSDGTVEGNNIAFQVTMAGPMGSMLLRFKGTIDGDKISGNVELGSFGSSTFSGARG